MPTTHADTINADLLAFLNAETVALSANGGLGIPTWSCHVRLWQILLI
jgi:hypothetical protein